MRPHISVRRLAIALVLLTSCSHAPSPTAAQGAGPGAAPTPMVPTQTTFDVQWKPQTVVLDKDLVARTYRGASSRDGTLTFDASATPVASLAAGSVVVIPGVALLRVSGVTNDGGLLHVAGKPAALDEAIANGHIAATLPVDFSRVALEPLPGMHRVDVADDLESRIERQLSAPADAETLDTGVHVESVGRGFHAKGEVHEWEIDLTVKPDNNNLDLDFDAKKVFGGGGAVIDLSGTGRIENLTNSLDVELNNGTTTRVTFNNENLRGSVDMKWTVQFDKDNGPASIAALNVLHVENLPFGFELPFFVGPIPFKIAVKTGFAFAPVFTSKTTVAQGAYHVTFGGGATATAAADAPASDGGTESLTSDATVDSYGGTLSVAPLGLSASLMMPSVGLEVGIPEELTEYLGENEENGGGPYVGLIYEATFVATGPLAIAPCERRELAVIGVVGYKVGLFGISLGAKRTQTVLKNVKLVVPPNIVLCQN